MRSKVKTAWFLLCATALGISAAHAADTDPGRTIREALSRNSGGSISADEVRPTPIAGLYEVQVGTEVMFVDSTGRYALVEGHMIDMSTRQDLTQQRLDGLKAISWNDLPLNKAVKIVKGKGTRVVATFEDPDCGWCQKVHRLLAAQPDVTIYAFPYPSDASRPRATAAWCSRDRAVAWSQMMTQGTAPAGVESCATPIDDVLAWGRAHGIIGTPTMLFADGARLDGAPSPEALLAQLERSHVRR